MSMATEHVFLAPHPDDISFSAYGSLMRLWAGAPRLLITVFSTSCWTFLTAPRRENWREVTARRLEEDTAFAAACGCRHLSLGLRDTSLRDYRGGREYVTRPAKDPASLEAEEVLRAALADVPERAVLYVPLGISHHLDHLIVRDAARRLRPGGPLVFYEDLPYVEGKTEGEIVAFARSFDAGLEPRKIDLGTLWTGKVRGMEFYASQLEPQTIGLITAYADRIGEDGGKAERTWARHETFARLNDV